MGKIINLIVITIVSSACIIFSSVRSVAEIISKWPITKHMLHRDNSEHAVSMDGKKYVIRYQVYKKHYININGKTYGPYDWFPAGDIYNGPGSPDDDRPDYFMLQKGVITGLTSLQFRKNYYYYGGKIYGPYAYTGFLSHNDEGGHFIFRFNRGGRMVKNNYTDTVSGGKWYFNIDGREQGPYDWIPRDPQFSKAGNHYTLSYKLKGQYHVAVDGKTYGPFESCSMATFSRNGSRYAFSFIKKGHRYIYLDGKQLGPYERIGSYTFSPDGRHFSFKYIESMSDYLVIDEKTLGPFHRVFPVTFSESGNQVSYKYMQNGKYYRVLNNRTFGPYDSVNDQVSFSGSDGRVSFLFKKNGRDYAYVDGKIHGPYEDLDIYFIENINDFALSYWNKGMYWKIGKKLYGPYQELLNIFFDKKKELQAVAYMKNRLKYLKINNKVYGPCSMAPEPVFLEKRKDFAFRCVRGNGILLQMKKKRLGPYMTLWGPKFSPDEKHMVYVYKKGRNEYVYFDGKTTGPYDRAEIQLVENTRFRISYTKKGHLYLEEIPF